MNPKWEYGGIETALNGLTKWMYNNIELTGNSKEQYEQLLKLIVKYAEANIPGFKKVGHLHNCADFIAKKIQRNNKFSHFTDWVKNTKK